MDFQTLELYSLQEQYTSYYIRDYYVRLDQTEDGMEIEAVYAPERDRRDIPGKIRQAATMLSGPYVV